MASPLDAAQRGCSECTWLQALSHSKNDRIQNLVHGKHICIKAEDCVVCSVIVVSRTQLVVLSGEEGGGGAIGVGEVILGNVFIFILFL